MKLFVSGSTRQIRHLAAAGWGDVLGCLRVPGETPNTVPAGIKWAMDNGCYSGLKVAGIRRLLHHCAESMIGDNPPHFVNVPDVVCDWDSTLQTFLDFRSACLDRYGYIPWNLAICLQDGIPKDAWDQLHAIGAGAVFIGGSDHRFKLHYCERIAQEAAEDGAWVHCGRINGHNHLRRARDMGCIHSCDGSGFNCNPAALLPALKTLRNPRGEVQHDLF